jgi:hypothetical protein
MDIFETPWVGRGIDQVQSAMHYDGYKDSHQKISHKESGLNMTDGGWHVFGLDWSPEGYRYYYDGKLAWETDWGGVSDVPQFIQLTDEIGEWGGDIRKAKLPDYYLIDYVRVYKSK